MIDGLKKLAYRGYDSSGISTSYSAPGGGNNYAELRGSFMVAAMGDGAGTLHYQQVQISGASWWNSLEKKSKQ